MKIFVTGGAGFIGSNLIERLLSKHHTVCTIDNFCDFYDPQIKQDNIGSFKANPNFRLIEGDIRNAKLVVESVSEYKPDVVIHLAAMAGVRPSIENIHLYNDVNINGTLCVLEACKKSNVSRMIFASSSSVYGNNKKVPFSESDNVDFPISPYAATKKAGELLCYTYHHLYNISMICLRFFTVYGPKQRPDLAISKFTTMISNNEEIPVYGDGESKRDYTYIDDIIEGIELSIDYVQRTNCYEIFNLGESRTISLNSMISAIEQKLGIVAQRIQLPTQQGDVLITYADIAKSKELLGYNPSVSFTEGIFRFVEWYKKLR